MRKALSIERGELRAALRGGDRERLLNACARGGIAAWDLGFDGEGALCLSLYEDDLEKLEKLALICMCECEVISRRGGSGSRRLLRRRAWPAILGAVCALLLAVSSLFIWDIEVIGNERLSDGTILRALADCGVSEGCFWPASDVERVRSEMLLRVEELSWITVNVSGSRATVIVLEREKQPTLYDERAPADLVADCGGVIADCAVRNGQTLVAPGALVTEGQTLVSGRMETLGGAPLLVRAEGEILADTWREQRVQLRFGAREKTRERGVRAILGVQLGRNRVNLLTKSRKELDECDRIVKEYKIGIEGVFRIPLSFVVELYRPYRALGEAPPDGEAARTRAIEALLGAIDGELVSCSFTQEDGALVLHAHCLENIARTEELR